MNKIIIAVVAVAIILAGGYFFLKNTGAPALAPSSDIVSQSPSQEIVSSAPEPKNNQEFVVQEQSQPENNVIVYADNNGFFPNSLNIKKGETVIFKNQSSKTMWPASAMHPTHKVYPTTGGCLGSTFDACRGILPGASWSFKFDIEGEWKYHDHLNPFAPNFGSITVEN